MGHTVMPLDPLPCADAPGTGFKRAATGLHPCTGAPSAGFKHASLWALELHTGAPGVHVKDEVKEETPCPASLQQVKVRSLSLGAFCLLPGHCTYVRPQARAL